MIFMFYDFFKFYVEGLTGPSQSSQQDESDYMPIQDSDEVPMSQSHKRVRKRKSTNPMAYPSRQPVSFLFLNSWFLLC